MSTAAGHASTRSSESGLSDECFGATGGELVGSGTVSAPIRLRLDTGAQNADHMRRQYGPPIAFGPVASSTK
jgi:hypothetical protein